MKVTKLIREYVEEQVSKVYDAKENPYSKQAEIDKKIIEDFQRELHREQRESIDNFLKNTPLFDGWNNYHPIKVSTSVPGFSRAKTQAMVDEETWKNENIRQKNAKIREIMIALELGANRQELNEMIAKLLEE